MPFVRAAAIEPRGRLTRRPGGLPARSSRPQRAGRTMTRRRAARTLGAHSARTPARRARACTLRPRHQCPWSPSMAPEPDAFPLAGRSFLALRDFDAAEIEHLLALAARLKQEKEAGREGPAARRPLDRADLREGLDPHPDRLRGRRLRPGRPRDVPRPERQPRRQEGVGQGHGARARPRLRRHRVPRLPPGRRRGPRTLLRRPRLQRPDRRGPPDPGPRRPADDPRARREAARRRSRSRTSATRTATWATSC